MKRIILIQFRTNNDTLKEEKLAFEKALTSINVELVTKNAFLDNLDWSNFLSIIEGAEGVILGGSGEFDFDGGRNESDEKRLMSHKITEKMLPFLKFLEEKDFPTLAVCFGHQIIGKSLGVSVINNKMQAKVGSHKIYLTAEAKNDPVFKDLPDSFIAQYGHKDSLGSLPPNATLLVCGERCFYSALRYGNNRYSVQFHPELDAEDVLNKFKSHPDYLPPDSIPEKLVEESPHATKILLNFVKNLN
jgi:GMP synthase (glutamine-hydrolysing)